jgi:hypothetical protein
MPAHTTAFDYSGQLPAALKILFEAGPLTTEELGALRDEQLVDYFHTLTTILGQEGEDKFKAERQTLRSFFLLRLAEGRPLCPGAQPQTKPR